MALVLPVFVRKQTKLLYCVGGCLMGGTFYILSNHSHWFPAHQLRLTSVDQAIPFIPETVWIYNSDMILFPAAYLVSNSMTVLSRYLYSFLFVLLISVAIFLFWPTIYPRDLFPLPPTLDTWTAKTFNHLRNVDTPANCLPSLHVSMSYLAAFIYLDHQREKFAFFFTWATLVALSTLTTKQHYLADVVTGFALAMTAYFIFHRLVKYDENR
jgi:membrane-associated phospholipid phosphatase